jgi:hypothetical protein
MAHDLVKLDLARITDEEAIYFLEVKTFSEKLKSKKNG